MATISEVREKLGLTDMDIMDVAKIMAHNGHSIMEPQDKTKMLADFVKEKASERYVCLMLGLETEEEKMSRAAIDSAKSARESAHWAMVAAFTAIVALLLSIYTLMKH